MALTRLMVLGIPGKSRGSSVFVDPDPVWSETQDSMTELWTKVDDGTVETWSALSTTGTVETWAPLSTVSTSTWVKLLRFS